MTLIAAVRSRAWVSLTAVAFCIAGLSYNFLWMQVVHGVPVWEVPGDIWGTMRDAHFIAWGGFGAVYSTGAGLVALPGMPLLLSPLAALSSALGLSEGFPYLIPHPTAWYVVGPAVLAIGTTPIFALDSLAARLGIGDSRRRWLVAAVAVMAWPVVAMWGHPEDSLALALVVWGLGAVIEDRWTAVAWLFGAALCIQPLAALAVFVALGAAGAKRAPLLIWRMALFPALVVGITVAAAPHSTLHALLSQPNYPKIDWPTPWVLLAPSMGHGAVAAGPGRVGALVVAVALGIWVLKAKPDGWGIVYAAGLAFAARCVLEAVMVPYYVLPAVALLVVSAAKASRARFVGAASGGIFLTVYTFWHWLMWPWYAEVVLLLACLAWLGRPRTRGDLTPEEARESGDAVLARVETASETGTEDQTRPTHAPPGLGALSPQPTSR